MYWFNIGNVEIMFHPKGEKKDSGDSQFHVIVDKVNKRNYRISRTSVVH